MTIETESNSQNSKWLSRVREQWKEFFIHINPIDFDSFRKERWYSKIYSIFRVCIISNLLPQKSNIH